MTVSKDDFRKLVAGAADRATRDRKTASVQDFAKALGERHAAALALLTRADYAALRGALAAWRKRAELEAEAARVFTIAGKLDAAVRAGAEFADDDLVDAEPTP